MREPMKPFVGLTVLYDNHGVAGGYASRHSPAIVQSINPDGSLNLFVIGRHIPMMVDNVIQGTGAKQWCFIPDPNAPEPEPETPPAPEPPEPETPAQGQGEQERLSPEPTSVVQPEPTQVATE